jgi:hypothetical protein
VNLIANRSRRGFQLADRGCNPAVGQVVIWVIVKPDDQDSGMMASGSGDQVMEIFEVWGSCLTIWRSGERLVIAQALAQMKTLQNQTIIPRFFNCGLDPSRRLAETTT